MLLPTSLGEAMNASLNTNLEETDPEVKNLIELEKIRQYSCLELIASENFTSQAVLEACGSIFTNKYSEGLPNCRYYGGNEVVDQLELLCQKRALQAFDLDPNVWGCNVQPYSGSTANFAAYTALINPNDKLMGLDLPSGGHLTHGYQTSTKKISATSIYFQSKPYKINSQTGLIDYEQLEKDAYEFKPNLLICGASAYPRDFDYKKLKDIANANNAYLLCDMAHISGLVAANKLNSPFEYCDVVTTTTHKTLRGPRAGLIFFKKTHNDSGRDIESRINQAVFPGCQGGPHNHIIAGIAVALKLANTPEFKKYCEQVQANSKTLAKELMNKGYKMVSNGTENHLILWDLRPLGVTGSKYEKVCDMVNITLNKNSVHGDKSALSPGGVRIGTAAMTSRSLLEEDFVKIANYLHRALELTIKIQEFNKVLETQFMKEIKEFKSEITLFSRSFPMPGFDIESIDQRLLNH